MSTAIKVRAITTLSSTIEFYDFALFLFLAPVISQHFFPDASHLGSIMPALLVYFAGYLARFVGGLFYSHFGDVYGRKNSYMYSIIIISMATFAIALLPGYETWGVAAPVLLLLLRIIQGLSIGGEVPGALTFAAEHSQPGQRGMVTGLIIAGLTLGTAFASGAMSGLYFVLGDENVRQWGWRLAFLLGAIMGAISLWLRFSLSETPAYQQLKNEMDKTRVPLKRLVHDHKMALVKGISIATVPALCFSVLFFLPRLQGHYLHTPMSDAFSLSSLSLFMLTLLALFTGYLSDKVGRVPMIKGGALIVLIFFPTGIHFLLQGNLPGVFVLSPLLLGVAALNGTYEAAIVELFPTHTRYSGVAFCHNASFGIIAGLNPLLLEWFCRQGLFYLMGVIPALFALWLLCLSVRWQERNKASLESF
ncbi:MFS transporter [Candidatus Sororendozoicomonas aggregata]|uniref:MFS transporter n=1 Tax=Candidatus Sororendozoicomonas aggregata TaxID=3073239 RepID=UPI002ED482B4